mmetsp:Transcript_23131/g.45517  ORF Transcript_23131/g.45517 Transcript_23131/m.45517 type:complete len:195 (-) Transcript_23131:414-998(-)
MTRDHTPAAAPKDADENEEEEEGYDGEGFEEYAAEEEGEEHKEEGEEWTDESPPTLPPLDDKEVDLETALRSALLGPPAEDRSLSQASHGGKKILPPLPRSGSKSRHESAAAPPASSGKEKEEDGAGQTETAQASTLPGADEKEKCGEEIAPQVFVRGGGDFIVVDDDGGLRMQKDDAVDFKPADDASENSWDD